MDPRHLSLRYLYIGSADTGRDLETWQSLPGASLRWRFRHFGADVAAVDLGAPPVLLVADHRPAGSVLPIYAVDDLGAAVAELARARARCGWEIELGPVGTPEGPTTVLRNASGVGIALLQVDRPYAMEWAYSDVANDHAVR